MGVKAGTLARGGERYPLNVKKSDILGVCNGKNTDWILP
jgi:hypothetical protein